MNTSLESVKNYVLLGPPGSGKSTQATKLKEALSLSHVDVGSELRKLAESETDLGKRIHEVINIKKELVSDGLIGCVVEHVIKGIESDRGVLIDGAPRRISQVDEVEAALASHGRKIARVIFLDLSLEEAVKRISIRFLCLSCKKPFIKKEEMSFTCDQCGGEIGQRQDDTPEGVAKRYEVFMSETRPVIEYFEEQRILLRIDARLLPDEIFDILMKKIA
ncbi:MAG: nucleoside monophosphate kinase [Candidatus Moranbacteria bacterium]|nr:nucleoside monophosphate kinase [Candidatus Moranbacteria bacterium]